MDKVIYTPVRKPCPSEARVIARHEYRFCNSLLVAGIYELPSSMNRSQLVQIETFASALKECLKQHPFLSVVVKKTAKNNYMYARASHVNLNDHFHVIDLQKKVPNAFNGADSNTLFSETIQYLCNDPALTFFDCVESTPPWRLDILPLSKSGPRREAFISFTYAHYIADGMSGIAFQKSFLKALRKSVASPIEDADLILETQPVALPQLPHLPVTPMYLLGPALGHYLPSFLSRLLGLKASASGSDEGTWAGPQTFVNSPTSSPRVKTAVEIATISGPILSRLLATCRKHNTKLTSLLAEIISKCLSRQLPQYCTLDSTKTNFIASTPTNIRKLAGVSNDTIGVFSSTGYSQHTIDRSLTPGSKYEITEEIWSRSQTQSASLAKAVATLRNQPVALLGWISDIDAWMAGQLDKPRDASFELSNLMSFEGNVSEGHDDAVIMKKMFFSQPAEAVGQPMIFNAVSVREGDLVVCCVWQVGAIGLDQKEGADVHAIEREFMKCVVHDLEQYATVAANEPS